jgi:hypothetical protein
LDYITVAAVAVFAVTLFLMIKRPRGLRLGYAAGIGAVASLLLGNQSTSSTSGTYTSNHALFLLPRSMRSPAQLTIIYDCFAVFPEGVVSHTSQTNASSINATPESKFKKE